MTISKIAIENIRGFENVEMNVNLRPNHANILVAPNGFGKSSISTAFNCAKGSRLNVDEKDKHQKNGNLASKLAIVYNGKRLEASGDGNEISDIFDVHVIKSNVEPKAKLPKINGFTVAKPYLEIPSIDLGPAVAKEKIKFNANTYKSSFGNNSKLVPNLAVKCDDEQLRVDLLKYISCIDKLKQKKSSDLLDQIIQESKNSVGTKTSISDQIEALFGQAINEIPHLKSVFDIVSKHCSANTWLDSAILCKMLMDVDTVDRNNLKKWLLYAAHSRRIEFLRSVIGDINGAWVTAEIKETKGRVRMVFPDASSLSNGQRDLLYFACNLLRARELNGSKPCILLIDEVFDYLDDANIVVAQYFMSRLIEDYRKESGKIYICLLTHLDPMFFRGYALRRQHTVYLAAATQNITQTMRKVITLREDSVWESSLSRYFLHYHPENHDIVQIFNGVYELPKKHGMSHGFYSFLEEEWRKYVEVAEGYDPFAVCAYVRVKIEECAFSKLKSDEEREEFLLRCNGTVKKLAYAESVGVEVPEACLLLGVVYNDALHRKDGIEQSSNIAIKLKNLALQSMMRQAVRW